MTNPKIALLELGLILKRNFKIFINASIFDFIHFFNLTGL